MPTISTVDGSQTDVTPAVVEVGPVNFNDESAAFVNTDDGIWDDYMITSRYEQDRHLYMMGVTSPDGFQSSTGTAKVAFAQLAYPTLLWIIDWTAQRRDTKPTIPRNYMDDANWILLDEFMEPGMVVVPADGVTPIYRISGTMFFGNKNPDPLLLNNAKFTRPPWLNPDTFDRNITIAMWENGLVR